MSATRSPLGSGIGVTCHAQACVDPVEGTIDCVCGLDPPVVRISPPASLVLWLLLPTAFVVAILLARL